MGEPSDAVMQSEKLMNMLSILTLVVAGLFFLYEGSTFIAAYKENPAKVSKKMVVAGSLTIALGLLSFVLAFLHVFILPK